MEIITTEQALERAREIAEVEPPAPTSTINVGKLVDYMKKYFPEFVEFPRTWMAYSLSAAHAGQSCFVRQGTDHQDDEFVFDIDAAARYRVDLYADGYGSCDTVLLDDIFDFLSFGKTPPDGKGALNSQCRDLSRIWSAFLSSWPSELGKMKVGMDSDIAKRAFDTGVDMSVAAYYDGVPVEYLADAAALSGEGVR